MGTKAGAFITLFIILKRKNGQKVAPKKAIFERVIVILLNGVYVHQKEDISSFISYLHTIQKN